MDSKLIVRAMLIVTLLFAAIFTIILYVNGFIGNKKSATQVKTVEEAKIDTDIA